MTRICEPLGWQLRADGGGPHLASLSPTESARTGGTIVHKLTRGAIAAISLVALLLIGCGTGAPPASTATPGGGSPTATAASPSPIETAQPTTATSATPAVTPGSSAPAELTLPTDVALFGTGLVPEGWQLVEDATGACRIAVPPDWTTGIAPGTGQTSALAEGVAGVSATTQTWQEFKSSVDQFYLTGHVVLIDTDDVFLIANPISPDFDLSYVLGLRFDDVNCMLLGTVQRNWITQYGAQIILVAETLDHT